MLLPVVLKETLEASLKVAEQISEIPVAEADLLCKREG